MRCGAVKDAFAHAPIYFGCRGRAQQSHRCDHVGAGAPSGSVIANVHLVDGTYELFRHFHAIPSAKDEQGREVAAVRGVLASMRNLVRDGATHVAIATDHIIESFRNTMWPGYKNGDGIDPALRAQFPLLEEALVAEGFLVWPMIDYEADHALGAAAAIDAPAP